MSNLIFKGCISSVQFDQTHIIKGIQPVRIDFFWFILKVANIRCFILIKCSEQEARFKKYVVMS